MAAVVPIGKPVNEAERQVIAHLRDHLPSGYLVLHNFEIPRDGETFEIDLAVIAPHAVFLVDVKSTRGLIDVYGPKWYPEGRQAFSSPLAKLRGHAKAVKGIITGSQPGRRDLEDIYVDAAVVLTAPDAALADPGGRDLPNVTTLKKAAAFFTNAARIPAGKSKNIGAHHNIILKALQGVAKPRSGQLQFGNWVVSERLGGTDSYTEYRVRNAFAAPNSTALIRAYQADPYKPPEERDKEKLLISTAFRTLNTTPGHPAIVGVRDFFPSEGDHKYFLVTEDVVGQALRLHITKPAHALTLGQKNTVAADLLNALVHLTEHKVVHRNLSPANILVGADGHARLTGFDFARPGTDHSRTIAQDIVDDLEPSYMAPEIQGAPGAATPSSDLFSLGLVLYELFTSERPFKTPTELSERKAVFAVKPSAVRPQLNESFDVWLQKLCAYEPGQRPSAAAALAELRALLEPSRASASAPAGTPPPPPSIELDYSNLLPQTQLTPKYVIEKRLGKPGSFAVAYKVIDTLGDVSRAVKLVLRDRVSTVHRLKIEYKTLLQVPDHPNVVKVIDADLIPGGPPFLVFEFIEGFDVGEMIESNALTREDALELARHVAAGLAHLHEHGVHHCDIKPRNLLWTGRGTKIIDFNVSVSAKAEERRGGGSRRYLPPDLVLEDVPTPSDLADRDLYALGLTLYEAVTNRYPWDNAQIPPPGVPALDPRELSNLADLAPDLVEVMLKAIAPKRADRFPSAADLRNALTNIPAARRAPQSITPVPVAWGVPGDGGNGGTGAPIPPNTNPYVRHLLTVYSQSKHSNAGTRGLDAISEQTYVETALDRELLPSVLSGEFALVIITGNAGDGKTAFLQKLERKAADEQALVDHSLPNGARIELRGRTFLSNYDGSQDEGDQKNDDVLRAFLAPFKGNDSKSWAASKETRLIAINEGRLVDFLEANRADFPALAALVKAGLRSGEPTDGVAVVNLNLRSVVIDPHGQDNSILERLVNRMTHEKFWDACHACDLKERCYAFHNAQTIQDETAGKRVVERLKSLYAITHLRGRLHLTLRDLRSALAYMLVGTRDCDEIHELYKNGQRDEIVQGFYFNSWKGGDAPNADRLLTLLSEVDVAEADDPRLDRGLDFVSPTEDRALFRFERRGGYDREILRSLYDELPRDISGKASEHRALAHRRFIAMARRRAFFERRDAGWRSMLPYKTAGELLAVVLGEQRPEGLLDSLLAAINRGEGLTHPERIGNNLALEVRRVDGGSVRSYRLYPPERFSLALNDQASRSRFVEHMPTGLVLRYRAPAGLEAELLVSLDVYEMLRRLNEGYRPSVEEEQGFSLSLAVFKNLLGSAPYQEVLLSTSGHDFYRVTRQADGRLEMTRAREGAA